MDDLIVEFLTETNDSIGELDNSMVLLEQDPGNSDLLSKIFRVMHTIKGTSGFLGLPRLGKVAHKSEDLLGLFRDGKQRATSSNVSLILESLDCIKAILAGLESEGQEPLGDDSDLISRLETACSSDSATIEKTTPSLPTEADEFGFIPIPAEVNDEPSSIIAEEVPILEPTQAHEPKDQAPAKNVTSVSSGESALANQSLRVSVDVLEDLMTMVSELVLTRNQIMQISRTQKDNAITTSLQRLNHIVSELQEGVMKTRMQPVGNAWSKLPRIVRDISAELGKKIDLEMHGQDTELDRQVLEMIKDPLTHMVRNAGDHGIETPAERVQAGKTENGKIKLSSWHEGGHIIIEISDDGKGLPLERIKKKILQNGLATETEIATMSDQCIQQYIFDAGFSTAEKITAVSGRGVGMDVVRSNIEKISGSIEMKSIEGKGTTFTIKIPLTLAIVSSIIIGIGKERFALPQLDVSELVITNTQGANSIETINGTPILRLREQLLPLICLKTLLKIEGEPRAENKPLYIAVIKVGGLSAGLIVDHIYDTEEIVVKPVTSLLRNITAFTGNTILGDGQVIMILDPSGIMKSSGIANNPSLNQTLVDKESAGPEKPLLLFYAGNNSLKAVPLENVARLEEIDLADIELAGKKRVIQYGNTLMPLYVYGEDQTFATKGRRPVIVFSTREGLSGLIVDKILDITSFRGEYQIKSQGSLEGSVIIQGQTTDVINLSHSGLEDPVQNTNYVSDAYRGLDIIENHEVHI